MAKFVSIIITHYAMNGERSEMMRASLKSLFESTNYPYELVVVDNGGSIEDSRYLLDLCEIRKINTYIRNSNNMHFGYARNQGLAICQGDYICIADNDILYRKDWLKECIDVLEAFPEEKIYTTPIDYPTNKLRQRYYSGTLEFNGKTYQRSMRAGSNCFVIRREDFKKVGQFFNHRIAGSKWTDTAVNMGYLAVIIPGKLIDDLGLRKGYGLNESIPITLKLSNGKEIFFNNDGYRRDNVDLEFILQKVSF